MQQQVVAGTRQAVADAVRAGMVKGDKGKNARCEAPPAAKRAKRGMLTQLDSDSEDDSSGDDEDEVAATAVEHPGGASSSSHEAGPSGVKDLEMQDPPSVLPSKSAVAAAPEAMAGGAPVDDAPVEEAGAKETPAVQEPTTPEEDEKAAPAQLAQEPTQEAVQAAHAPSAPNELDMAPFRTANELAEGVPLESIRGELKRRGLKFGGTAQQAAQRLWNAANGVQEEQAPSRKNKKAKVGK